MNEQNDHCIQTNFLSALEAIMFSYMPKHYIGEHFFASIIIEI